MTPDTSLPQQTGMRPPAARTLPMSAVARTVRDAAELLKGSPAAGDHDVARVTEMLEDLAGRLEKRGKTAKRPAPAPVPEGHASVGPGGLGYLMALSPEEEEVIDWGAHDVT